MAEQSDLENFVMFNFSHNSAEEFFGSIGVNMGMYRPIHLTAPYVGPEDEGRIHRTELSLARVALQTGCGYVTNIDYCEPCIAATGWKKR